MSTDAAPETKTETRTVVSQEVKDLVFTNARTHHAWSDKDVSDEQLKAIYDLFKWGPNAFNAFPIRIVFVKSKDAKEKLVPALMEGNVPQVRAAPVTAIIAYDLDFVSKFDITSPNYDAASLFKSMPAMVEPTAVRNSTLLGAYFMIAARLQGLDVGPMSGFDNGKVDETFFKGTQWKSNFLCNIGYGDASKLYPRAPRLDFNDATKIL